MKLPDGAIVSERKIKEYLLTPRAEDDKSGFLALASYSLQTWRQLEMDLLREAKEGDALLIRTTQYGEIYHIKGQLKGPNGTILDLITVWIWLRATGDTRFATLVPDKEAGQ